MCSCLDTDIDAKGLSPARDTLRDGNHDLPVIHEIVTPYNNHRPANSHGFAVSLTVFCHFSRSHDKAPSLTVFGKNLSGKEVN